MQRFALSAGGANAMSLGSMGMGVPGLLSGMGVGMMPNILSGMDVMPRMEELTRVVCLSQVCFCNTTITGTFLLIEINRTRSTCEKSICPVCYAGCLSRWIEGGQWVWRNCWRHEGRVQQIWLDCSYLESFPLHSQGIFHLWAMTILVAPLLAEGLWIRFVCIMLVCW